MKNNKPELFFLIIILICGFVLIFITPIGAGTDEDTHLARIWEMSTGEFIPNRYLGTGPNYPYAFYELSYRQDLNLNPINWEAWKTQTKVKIDWNIFINHTTRAIYFPTFYIVQAFIMGITGRVLDFPVVIIYYLLRLSYLLFYAGLIYISVKLVPVGKWLLGTLAITPMSLIQSSIISADGLNNGIVFVFIAWILYLNTEGKRNTFRTNEYVFTLLISFFICTLKINALPLLLLLFLIPSVKLGRKPMLAIFIACEILFILFISLGWTYFTSTHFLYNTTENSFSAIEQFKGIFLNPGHLIKSLVFTFWTHAPHFIRDWVGTSGYGYWVMPLPVYIINLLTVFTVLISENNETVLSIKKRLLIFITSIVTFLATMVIFYLIYNRPDSLNIPNIHGRYLIFIAPLFLIPLIPHRKTIRIGRVWLQSGVILSSLLSILFLFAVYHVNCGQSYFSFKGCTLPKYKNWSPETALVVPLNSKTTLIQSFVPRCNHLSGVSIWVAANSVERSALTISLQTAEGSQLLSKQEIPIGLSDKSGFTHVNFPPNSNSNGVQFWLNIQSFGDFQSGNSGVLITPRNEYNGGELFINDVKQIGDLIFTYQCDVGLIRLVTKD